jgi:hypothetical protein
MYVCMYVCIPGDMVETNSPLPSSGLASGVLSSNGFAQGIMQEVQHIHSRMGHTCQVN